MAKRILPHGLVFAGQILCDRCAKTYDEGLVDEADDSVVEDAFLRISSDLIGRIGIRRDRVPACYECEEEL